METQRWDKKLSEFLDMVDHNDVRVNRRYQRSGKVWPLNAKSYLVETVILNFVLPRLLLHEVPARRGAPAYTDIVDGQQRTAALRAFRHDEFRLSGAVDRPNLKGKKYSTLEPQDRQAFDAYVLRLDRFTGATDAEIREVFRRINSYTVPLNAEEQRHARFQGEFKWFIHRQIERFDDALKESGVLTEKQMNRMADGKLLTEIVHALVHGISTTNGRSLRKMYADHDREFPLDRDLTRRLSAAKTTFAAWGRLPKAVAKHYHAYALLLALMHCQQPVEPLKALVRKTAGIKSDSIVLTNLGTLASVLDFEEDEVPPEYEDFYAASEKGTNVRAAREARFRWYVRALTSNSL